MDNFGTVHETGIFGTSAEPHLAFLQPGMRLDVAGSQYFHVAGSAWPLLPWLLCLQAHRWALDRPSTTCGQSYWVNASVDFSAVMGLSVYSNWLKVLTGWQWMTWCYPHLQSFHKWTANTEGGPIISKKVWKCIRWYFVNVWMFQRPASCPWSWRAVPEWHHISPCDHCSFAFEAHTNRICPNLRKCMKMCNSLQFHVAFI